MTAYQREDSTYQTQQQIPCPAQKFRAVAVACAALLDHTACSISCTGNHGVPEQSQDHEERSDHHQCYRGKDQQPGNHLDTRSPSWEESILQRYDATAYETAGHPGAFNQSGGDEMRGFVQTVTLFVALAL